MQPGRDRPSEPAPLFERAGLTASSHLADHLAGHFRRVDALFSAHDLKPPPTLGEDACAPAADHLAAHLAQHQRNVEQLFSLSPALCHLKAPTPSPGAEKASITLQKLVTTLAEKTKLAGSGAAGQPCRCTSHWPTASQIARGWSV